ncbi:hypothetical protein QZH41_016140, partial [Actinostola sp. cb2023]
RVCEEWKVRAPLFYSFLMTSASNKRTKASSWFGSVAVAGSVLLKQRSEKMDATSSVLGIIMKTKSIETPLGLIFKNENVNEDMVAILKEFHSYLPQTGDQGVDGQLFSGDQLTVERAVNVIASVANGFTPKDRLEGINMQLGDWHAAVKLLSVSRVLFAYWYI